MSEIESDQPKPKSPRDDTDKDAFEQIERWMALIREVCLEEAKA